MKKLAIIAARGGSKRIPNKNIKHFNGIPIIKYSIDAAIQSAVFDDIVVSTDSKKIGDIAVSYGAELPFYRSEINSSDNAGLFEVIEEVIKNLENMGRSYDLVCCILPTAPFLKFSRLIEASEILTDNSVEGVVPVVEFSYPIQRSLVIGEKFIKMKWPEYYHSRSQDLMKHYHDCGQFFFMKVDHLLEQKNLYLNRTIPLVISEKEVQDIDTMEDWDNAETKYKILHFT